MINGSRESRKTETIKVKSQETLSEILNSIWGGFSNADQKTSPSCFCCFTCFRRLCCLSCRSDIRHNRYRRHYRCLLPDAGGAIAKIINAKKKNTVSVLLLNLPAVLSSTSTLSTLKIWTSVSLRPIHSTLLTTAKGPWEGKPVSKLRAVFALAPEAVTFVAAEDSGIKSINDVKGRQLTQAILAQATAR